MFRKILILALRYRDLIPIRIADWRLTELCRFLFFRSTLLHSANYSGGTADRPGPRAHQSPKRRLARLFRRNFWSKLGLHNSDATAISSAMSGFNLRSVGGSTLISAPMQFVSFYSDRVRQRLSKRTIKVSVRLVKFSANVAADRLQDKTPASSGD